MEKYRSYASLNDTKEEIFWDKNTVFLRKNFNKVNHELYGEVFEYSETRMTYEEYIALLDAKNKKLEDEMIKKDDLILDNAYRVAVLELNNQSAL